MIDLNAEIATTLRYAYKDSGGKEVVCDGKKTWGHLNTPTQEMFGGSQAEVYGTMLELTCPNEISPTQDATIKVDGTSYTVRRHLVINDGNEVRMWLEEV